MQHYKIKLATIYYRYQLAIYSWQQRSVNSYMLLQLIAHFQHHSASIQHLHHNGTLTVATNRIFVVSHRIYRLWSYQQQSIHLYGLVLIVMQHLKSRHVTKLNRHWRGRCLLAMISGNGKLIMLKYKRTRYVDTETTFYLKQLIWYVVNFSTGDTNSRKLWIWPMVDKLDANPNSYLYNCFCIDVNAGYRSHGWHQFYSAVRLSPLECPFVTMPVDDDSNIHYNHFTIQ
jgi:hypothetical protein